MSLAVDLEVSSTLVTHGGIVFAMRLMVSSGIGPHPEGISKTRPSASAPQATASWASSSSCIQQILMGVRMLGFHNVHGVAKDAEFFRILF